MPMLVTAFESAVAPDSMLGALRFVWRIMSPRRRQQFFVVLAMMLLGAAAELMTIGAVLPFLGLIADPDRAARISGLGPILAALGAREADEMVAAAALLLIAAAAFSAVVRLMLSRVSLRFVMWLSHEIGMTVFGRILRQPYSYFVTRNTSEVLGGVEKIQSVIWGMLLPAMQGLIGAVIALAIVCLLFVIDPFTATIAAAAMALSYVGVSLAVSHWLRRTSGRMARRTTERFQAIQEGLGGIRDVLLEQSQEVFEEKFRRVDLDYRRMQTIAIVLANGPRFVIEAIGIALIALLALFLSRGPGGIMGAIPVLGAMALGAQRLLPLLQQAYFGWSSIVGNRQNLLDVVGLLAMPVVTSVPRNRALPVTPFRQAIELRQVSFHYQGREPVLRDVDLTIPKGARIGFVGETGSGKSTLLDIVMGLLDPTGGTMCIDGEALADGNRAGWQAQIAHVPQTIYLTDDSIGSNIAFGEAASEIDPARVRRAAAMAHIAGFIDGLADGYETPVGERGVRLSGGQRQRIGIARALYKETPVLIFDEATSALDEQTERAIMTSIASLREDATLLIVAHRTSTLSGCDTVVRLAGGRIVETGSYQQVVLGSRPGRRADDRP